MLIIKGFKEKVRKCIICGEKHPNTLFVDKVGYVCHSCVNKELDYHTINDKIVGKENKNDITFSIEFETCKNSPETLILAKYGFIPTHDGSISGHEWKSPIFRGLQGIKPMLNNFNDLTKYIDSDCGTHIHVGTLSSQLKRDIKEQEYILFAPIMSRMRKEEEETRRFWGRTSTSYARVEFCHERYQAFNTRTSSSKPTLEFRLPKFQSGEQFYNVLKFATESTSLIKTKFEEADREGIDKAEIAISVSKGILNSYKKYASL